MGSSKDDLGVKKAIHPKNQFGLALRLARKSKNISQESFDVVSGRTYISSLERGLKSPTLEKVDQLASVVGVHPLTVLALSYGVKDKKSLAKLLTNVEAELIEILDRKSD